MCRVIADLQIANSDEQGQSERWERWFEKSSRVPACLAVVADKSEDLKTWEEDYGAVCCLMQNIQLLGWERGLGMVWDTNSYIDSDEYRECMGIKNDEKIIGLLHIGYFDQAPKPRTRTAVQEKWTIV